MIPISISASKLIRISIYPLPVKVMLDQKQLEMWKLLNI
jgi:hypothetical protein